jgi:hypothetical protein
MMITTTTRLSKSIKSFRTDLQIKDFTKVIDPTNATTLLL